MKGILVVGADKQATAGSVDTASAATPAHLHGPDELFAHIDNPGQVDQQGDEMVVGT